MCPDIRYAGYPAGYPAILAKTENPDPAGYQKLQKLSIRLIPVPAGYEKSHAGTSLVKRSKTNRTLKTENDTGKKSDSQCR